MDDAELAALQAALIHALHEGTSVSDVRSRLARAPLSDAARRWLAQSDPRALETASAIVQRWTEWDGEGTPEG